MAREARCTASQWAKFGKRRREIRRQRWSGIAFLALLLISLATGSAFADDGDDPSHFLLSQPDIEQTLEDPNLRLDGLETDIQAAEELPHEDLGRDGALELLSSVFGPQLQAPAGVFDDLAIQAFRADNVAVVAHQGAEPTLLDSNLPLRTENSSGSDTVVDLDLEHVDGELQPANPLVEVRIPSELGEGISLPQSGIVIEAGGASEERAPTTIADATAFYPNVASDTDLTVAPTPTGVETLTHIRSEDAPNSETFHLSLPEGADLQATSEGGARVEQAGETILSVPPPSAIDAKGDPVAVAMEVSGDSLILQASPEENAAYPILVDPIYETYYWSLNKNTVGIGDWKAASNSALLEARDWGYGGEQKGLNIYSYSGTVAPGAQANWNYHVPRFYSDYQSLGVRPQSYIDNLTLSNVNWWIESGSSPYPANPFVMLGIWDEKVGWWANVGVRTGTDGQMFNATVNLPNKNHVPDVKEGGVALAADNDTTSRPRHLWVGQASVEITDQNYPSFGKASGPSKWLNESASPIEFTASDNGLGVYGVIAKYPRALASVKQVSQNFGCVGNASSSCPRTWSGSFFNFDPKSMAQGENIVEMIGQDPVGHYSDQVGAQKWALVKVDHTVPGLALSGSLVDHASLGTLSANYNLKYTAADGFDATPVALTPIGPAGTGETKSQRPMGVATDGTGNVWMVDRENSRIIKFDEAGKYLGQFGSPGTGNGQFLDPRGIAVAPNGTIWVADAGRARIQQFNFKGEFLQGFGTKVSAPNSNDPTAFVEPWGVAAAPNGTIWVSDVGAGRVGLFNESIGGNQSRFDHDVFGSPSTASGKAELVAPAGIATDAGGNVWVVENGTQRVDAFDSSGQFRMRFGSEGTGNGQFKYPVGVAVSPAGHLLVTDGSGNRVQEFSSSGAYIRQFGSTGTANNQLQEPRGIAIGAGNVAFVADAANHRLVKWSGVDSDPQSGAASTEVKVDGALVEPKYAPGCSTKNCSISREWTLHANDYSSGQHKVQVIATDGVGLSATKELTITTDKTAPALTATSQFFTAPEGWLEQKSYTYAAVASDTGGYGVTSLALKIDGSVIKNTTQTCAGGGCAALLSGTINMATYKGGAHPAELIATDAAGNVSKKVWTINVDPKGEISTVEAVDTLEAVEDTSSANLLGDSEEEELTGTVPGLAVEETEDGIVATGTEVPTTIADTPDEGVSMEVLDEDPEGEGEAGLSEITFAPVQTAEGASETEVIADDATLATDTGAHVDTVIRPLYDGAMTFQDIRDKAGSENFSWEVYLDPGQELKSIDGTHAAVYFANGYLAGSIEAIPAHDAVGTNVSTKLSVSEGNVITLTVEHHATSFIYPVIAGAGWQGGFVTYSAEMPPPESSGEVFWEFSNLKVSAPEASISSLGESRKSFVRVMCAVSAASIAGVSSATSQVDCLNPFKGEHGEVILWQIAMRGAFFYRPGHEVHHNGAIACIKWLDASRSYDSNWQLEDAYQCHYGPKTADGNGGASASGGHYLRAQAHWLLGQQNKCYQCPQQNPWFWEDKAMELHLWPSGVVQWTVP